MGQLYQASREGQEDQLNALGLVVNAIGLWNTRYMEQVLALIRQRATTLLDDDVARLSRFGHHHITMLGQLLLRGPGDGRARASLATIILG